MGTSTRLVLGVLNEAEAYEMMSKIDSKSMKQVDVAVLCNVSKSKVSKMYKQWKEKIPWAPVGRPKGVKVLDSLFYEVLVNAGVDATEPYTRKLGPLDQLELGYVILIPVHLRQQSHWVLATIDLRGMIPSLNVWNSMENERVEKQMFENIKHWLKFAAKIDPDQLGWKCNQDRPKLYKVVQQTNPYDCGVFVCAYAKLLTNCTLEPLADFQEENVNVTFSMKLMRRLIMQQLLDGDIHN